MSRTPATHTTTEARRLFEEGVEFLGAGKDESAEQSFASALKQQPDFAEALFNLGFLSRRRGNLEEAALHFARCLELRPQLLDARRSLGNTLLSLNRPQEARVIFQEALSIHPGHPENLNGLGLALLALGSAEEAEQTFLEALDASPLHPDISCNLGAALHAQNRNAAASKVYRQILATHPAHTRTRMNLALSLLAEGCLAEAWPLFEARKPLSLAGSARNIPGKAWLGQESLQGKSMLLHAEQGLGDTLQFLRYLPHVLAKGATVHLEVQAPLVPLAALIPGLASVYPSGNQPPLVDYYCALGSLPIAFDTTLESIPPPNPGLHPDPSLTAAWKQKLLPFEPPPRIGLVWAGNPLHINDRTRSIPATLLFETLQGLPVHLFSLQTNPSAETLSLLEHFPNISNLGSQITHFGETAAILANLDLLICVDTSTAHLAGLLGKNTCLLLPYAADWRWLTKRSESPWYPSLKLFRQPSQGDWPGALAALRASLLTFLAQG